ncbi:MAG: Dna2/Cas4 domain-containing protein [Acidobacteriaceae bacterium]|nr:Dna2/Cas4 domain-containing protein [Acidobacteriaceae bacterium]
MNLQVMAATLLILALVLFLLATRSRRRAGIPAGELFYQDLSGQPFYGKPLRSHALGISGKPDCLIRMAEGIVPVELKKSNKPPARGGVYPSHMIQAPGYCALVEEQMQVTAPYALVIYAGQQVRRVDFTEERRKWLLDTICQLECAGKRRSANRNHEHRARCMRCGLRLGCDQALL